MKAQAEEFLLESKNGFWKGRFCIGPLFSMKLLIEKRREFNLETQWAFLQYMEAFRDLRENCLKYYKENIPYLLLKSITKIYSNNFKVKKK